MHGRIIGACALLLAEGALAAPEDHPMVSRYEGAVIEAQEVRDFAEYRLPLGPSNKAGEYESRHLEGRLTQTLYRGPAARSALEVFRNYEIALEQAGFETLFSCAGKACRKNEYGKNFGTAVYYGRPGGPNRWGPVVSYENGTQRFLAAVLERPEGPVYATVFACAGWWDEPAVEVDVIEVAALETDKVTASALVEEISREGRVAIYGIHFDTGRAKLKPASVPVLDEIAELMRRRPNLALYVVGHTDDTGDFDGNLQLSRRRAAAVVGALVEDYGIDHERLDPRGVGPLAPVSSNRAEGGRSRNRRVELVERLP